LQAELAIKGEDGVLAPFPQPRIEIMLGMVELVTPPPPPAEPADPKNKKKEAESAIPPVPPTPRWMITAVTPAVQSTEVPEGAQLVMHNFKASLNRQYFEPVTEPITIRLTPIPVENSTVPA